MLLRNYWYTACAASQLGTAPRTACILDRELVLFRDQAHRAHALLDRCCHRGVRLSLGRVRGNNLACGYHGWEFAGDGTCVHIPSLTAERRIPAKCGVPALPCVEQDGYVWVWLGHDSQPPAVTPPRPPRPPRIDGFDEQRWLQGSIELACSFVKGLENNLDWCHPAFAHPWTHGQFFLTRLFGAHDLLLELVPSPEGLTLRGPVNESKGAAAAHPRSDEVLLTFALPNCVTVEQRGKYKRRIIMYFVPTGLQQCRLEWLMTRTLPFGRRVRWVAKEPLIFRQDRVLMESAEPAYAAGFEERSVEADAPTLLLRRVLEWAASGEWDERRASLPARRLIRVHA